MATLLAGDIGGTKTLLSLYSAGGSHPELLVQERYASADWNDLGPMVIHFLQDGPGQGHPRPEAACLAVEGQLQGGTAWGRARSSSAHAHARVRSDDHRDVLVQGQRVALIDEGADNDRASGREAADTWPRRRRSGDRSPPCCSASSSSGFLLAGGGGAEAREEVLEERGALV
jgi:hypothetical protein